MSNPNGSSAGKTVLSCFGVGCGILLLIGIITALNFAGGGSGIAGVIFIAVIIGIVIYVAVRKDKNKDLPYSAPITPTVKAAPTAPVTTTGNGGEYASPMCNHSWSRAELESATKVKCACGYTFQSADLLKHAELNKTLAKTNRAIDELTYKMKSNASPARVAAAEADYVRPAVKKTVKPKVTRPKVNLSLQQWLIIGASVLVLVAGSVFVSSNMGKLDQWVFELITVGVAIATGFGAFKTRNISILLANFLAAFSSSMQLATMSIIGDQLSPDFEWNTMPAWWWSISLLVVSALATVLAKFSKNFGFKGIALLGSTGAAVVLSIGVLRAHIEGAYSPVFIALASLVVAVLFAQNRFLRKIEQPQVTDKSLAAYAKDVAKREDSSLRILGLVAAALELLVGIGLTITSVFNSGLDGFNWLAVLSIGAAWVALVLGKTFWIDQVEFEGASERLILIIGRGIVFSSLAASAGFAAIHFEPKILGAVFALAILFALIWFAPKAKSLSPNRVSVIVGAWLTLAIWVLGSHISLITDENAWVTGAFAIAFAALLSVSDLRFNVNRYDWGSLAVNGIGVSIVALDVVQNSKVDYYSFAYAGVALALVLATTLQLPLRDYVNKKQKYTSAPLTKWVAFFFGAVISALVVVAHKDAVANRVAVPLAAAFIIFSVIAQLLALRGRLAKTLGTYFVANHYLGQIVVALMVLITTATTGSELAGTNSLLIAALAVVNYGFGTFKRRALKMQLGFGAAILAFLAWQWSLGQAAFVPTLIVQIVVISLATWLHTWFLRKRAGSSEDALVWTPIVAIGTGSIFGWLVLLGLGASLNYSDMLQTNVVYATAGLIAAGASMIGPLSKIASRKLALGWVGVEFTTLGLLTTAVQAGDSTHDIANAIEIRFLVALVPLAIALWVKNHKVNNLVIVALFYLINLTTAFVGSQLTQERLGLYDVPENLSVWFAAALVISTFLTKAPLGSLRRILFVDVPVLASALWSFAFALSNPSLGDVNTWRGIISLAVIAAFAYWRSGNSIALPWLIVGYLSGLGSSLWLAHGIDGWLNINFEGPEFYSVLGAASIVVGNLFLVKRMGSKLTDLRLILTVGGLILPSLIYALSNDPQSLANELRATLALAIATGLSVIRITRSRAVPWSIATYVTAIGAAVALGHLVADQWLTGYEGPEIYTVLATLAIIGAHRVALKNFKFKTSLFAWGLPIAVLLFPSAIYTYQSLDIPFSGLAGLQIARIIVVLVLSAGLLTYGSRAGNLATSSMGLIGLALVAIPNTAMHSDNLIAGTSVDSTAVVVALLVFGTLAILRRYTNITGNSLLFIGLPIAIALAPALVQSLAALGNPTLTSVDWWRFGIVLISGLTLLVVGTLREVAGLFYPGLLAVLLSALPYGFKQTQQNQWMLWVLLLLIAGLMVWLAVRLERLKKSGKNSATWLKELK